MKHEPLDLDSRRVRIAERAAQIIMLQEQNEAEALLVTWLSEFEETLQRGGAAAAEFPYDIQGAWRLIESDDERWPFIPVVTAEELPEGREPKRPVVALAEVVHGECDHCHIQVPLMGRSHPKPYGMGDVTTHSEVALVHCDRVQLQNPIKVISGESIDFSPRIVPEDMQHRL
jgi:hypothetical protein